jgi:hypothetical protein
LIQATTCFGFTVADGLKGIQWIGATTYAVAGRATKHFVKTSVTRRLAGTLSDTAGTLTWATTGGNHWICFTVTNGLKGIQWIGPATYAIAGVATEHFVKTLVTRRLAGTLSDTAGTLTWATTGGNHLICFTVANGLKGVKWIGSATYAIAGVATEHFVKARVTRRLAGTLRDTAGTLTWAPTGGNHLWGRICLTVTNGIRCIKGIESTACAVAVAAEHFMQSLVTRRNTLPETARPFALTTTAGRCVGWKRCQRDKTKQRHPN